MGGNADKGHIKRMVTSWLTVQKDSSSWFEKAMKGQSLPMKYEMRWEAGETWKVESEGKRGGEGRNGRRASKA